MERTILFNEAPINYTICGTGQTLVLLHGFTESLEIWTPFSNELSTDFRVLCIDLPGHGKSACIGEVHTMELMAQCVKNILDKEQITECVMIGHSMGGYVSLAFAEKYAKMLKGIGLFHSSAMPDTPEGKINRARAIEFISSNHIGFIGSFIPDLFAPENRERLQNEIEHLVINARKMSKESIIASQKGMIERKDQRELLNTLAIPFLFIAGKKDSRVPFEKVLEQIALPKDCVSLLLDGIAHMGYLEAPEKTLYAIKCFVKGVLA